MPRLFAAVLLVFPLLFSSAPAAEREAKPEEPKAAKPPLEEKVSRTKGAAQIGGKRIEYTAEAGTLVLREEDGTAKASAFYVAYVREGATEPEKRPIAFCFNGGPGAGAVWLHLGALGPRKVWLDPSGAPQGPPYRLLNNDHSILDLTDLVFIDPVSTGLSRSAPGEDPKQFHGLEEDIRWVAEFIRVYTGRGNRWTSPKFLIGESYGTTRAAGLADYLQDRLGLYLNGVVLVSPVLNFATISYDSGNDLPYLLSLPTYTAAAWYHRRLGTELQKDRDAALKASEEFATREYATALMRGSSLSTQERTAVATRLSELTGVAPNVFLRANLRLPLRRFLKALLAEEERVLGIYDSRVTGFDPDPDRDRSSYDPSYENIQGAMEAAMSAYIRSELKYTSDLHYEILAPGKVHPWNYGAKNRYVDVSDRLAETMSKRPFLKLFVASGYYDLATPYYAALYTTRHLEIDRALLKNVTFVRYDAGHMLYTDEVALAKFKQDLTAFFGSAY